MILVVLFGETVGPRTYFNKRNLLHAYVVYLWKNLLMQKHWGFFLSMLKNAGIFFG